MDALKINNEQVTLDKDRCIGCGLCVSKCPSGSLLLRRRPHGEQPLVPKNTKAAFLDHLRARGKLKRGELVKMQIRSKIDRILSFGE